MSKGDQAGNASGTAKLPAGAQGLPRMRWLSIGLVLLVVVGTLVVPIKFKDSWWQSGPVHNAHTITNQGDGCKACHQNPFELVQESACLQCHEMPSAHVSSSITSAILDDSVNPTVEGAAIGKMNALEREEIKADMAVYRCTSCHREHEEPTALVPNTDGFCVDCHQKVTAFSPQLHPELSALKVDNGGGLKFDHEYHMGEVSRQHSAQGGNDNVGLACVDCHKLSADNEHFEPVDMDRDCRSCHALSMAAYGRERVLPHGEVDEIVRALEEYAVTATVLAREKPAGNAKKPSGYQRVIPGKQSSVTPECRGPVLSCAAVLAEEALEEQFQITGCITCHEVTQGELGNAENTPSILSASVAWQVAPIQMPSDWFEDARFDHKSHLAKGATDDQSCLDCHAALNSKSSVDVLMPKADSCFGCHDAGRADAVQLSCTACHDYHRITTSHELVNQTSFIE